MQRALNEYGMTAIVLNHVSSLILRRQAGALTARQSAHPRRGCQII